MAYATATINSVTPAKDLMAALGTTLTAGGMSFVESYGTPPAASWSGVAYGAGVFVAVVNGAATAASSADGITWTQRSLPATANWSAVTFGGGLFVAIATGSMIAATSPDGITWTLRALPAVAAWQAVAYGGGTFVAVTTGTTVAASSPDGITWTQRVLPAAMGATLAYGAGVFVAFSGSTTTAFATSLDGITWTARVMPVSATWQAVTFSGSLFVAVTFGSTIAASSPDGITWTQRVQAIGNFMSVTYGGGLFLASASGGSNSAMSSPDGIAWTARTLPAAATAWYGVAYGGGVFAAVANGTSIAASSPDGSTWTQRVLTPTSNSPMADVWKSPAASNQFGQDWYLILRRAGDYNATLYSQVAEGYSTVTHKASNYAGTSASVIPAATTFANPAAAVTPDSFGNGGMALSAAIPFTYWVSATANRFALGVKTSIEAGIYIGLYDDLLPAGVTQFPLVCAVIPPNQTSSLSIGSGFGLGNGSFTREPGQAASSNLNFEARIHNGWQVGLAQVVPGGYTPATSTAPQYGNPDSVARVMIGTGRVTTTLADGLRGLLIGCVTSGYPSVCGDTITSGGKTYVRLAGPALTAGIFVDSGL